MSAESMKEKGNEEFKKGNYEKAIEFYTYATEMDPKNHTFFTNRSLCYAQMKKWDKSLRDAEKSVQLKGDWEKGHYRRGVALLNLGRPKEAKEAFELCVRLNPKNDDYKVQVEKAKREMFAGMSEAEILKVEGNDLFKLGKIDDAIKRFTLALEKCVPGKDDTAKADIYANRAACYVQLYEPKKVLDDCNNALKLAPDHAKALLRRAQALESLEKYKEALADFETVLRMEPNADLALKGATRIRQALKRMEGK